MEVKLDSLIEKIKQDGLDEAKRVSEEIIGKARKDAADIIAQSQNQSRQIIEQARQEAAKLKSNAEDALRQAARDLTLSLRQKIIDLMDQLLKRRISAELSPDFVRELILKIVAGWTAKKDVSLEVLVNEKDKKKLEQLVFSDLKQEARKSIEVRPSDSVDKGFRIGIKGEETYYDFSDESILEVLKEFLNPAVAAMLNVDNG